MFKLCSYVTIFTAWKMSVFGVFLVRIFPHSDWIRRDTLSISPYSVWMRKNTDQKNPEEGHFSRAASSFKGLQAYKAFVSESCALISSFGSFGSALISNVHVTLYPLSWTSLTWPSDRMATDRTHQYLIKAAAATLVAASPMITTSKSSY